MWVCSVCVFCLVGLLVAAMMEVSFFLFSFFFFYCGLWWWVDVDVEDLLFLVSCGMGGRFVVVVV